MNFHNHQIYPNGDELCSYLPEELIVEILLRLPVRSLHQFKCICKSWKTLISHPQFVKRHLQFSTAEPSLVHQRLFFSFSSDPCKILCYPLKPLFQNLLPPLCYSLRKKHPCDTIIGSCNGLLCVYDRYRHCVRICNPSIMFTSKISPPAVSIDWINCRYGFGHDHVNDKYKVLLVVRNKKNLNQTLTKIYTFGEDSWKTIQNIHPTCLSPFSLLGKFVSGTLNWIVKKRDVSSNQIVIHSFDLEKDTYKEILLPQNVGYKETLYVLNNCLGVCHVSNKTHCVAWLMKEYGVVDSWTKFIIIPLDNFNKQPSIVIPMFLTENGVVLLVNKSTSQFLIYNLNSGELDYSLDDLLKSTSTLGLDPRNMHIYCESLLCL